MNERSSTSTSVESLLNSPLPARAALQLVRQAKKVLFEQLKAGSPIPAHLLHLALTEAEALAWQTPIPHLVFPVLAVEKAQTAIQWHVRQRRMRADEQAFAA